MWKYRTSKSAAQSRTRSNITSRADVTESPLANSVRSGKSCRPRNVVSVRLASVRTALRLDPNVRDPIPYYMLQNGGCASASSTARDAQNRAVSSGPIMISAPPEPDILGRRSGRASLLSLAALERHGLGRLVVVEAHDVTPSSRYSV